MIEEIILNFLAVRLDVPVRLSVPTPAPARFVVVEKTGSGYDEIGRASCRERVFRAV